MAGSMPLSFATTSIICCSSVAISVSSELHFEPRAADARRAAPDACAGPPSSSTAPSSTPASRPAKCDWPSTGSLVTIFASRPDEPPIVRLAAQRPIQARRRHLEGVRPVRRRPISSVFDVEQRAQILADALAVVDPDRSPQRGRVLAAARRSPADRSRPAGPSRSTRAGTAGRRSRARGSPPRAPRLAAKAIRRRQLGSCSRDRPPAKAPKNTKSGHGPTTKAFPAKTTRKYSNVGC